MKTPSNYIDIEINKLLVKIEDKINESFLPDCEKIVISLRLITAVKNYQLKVLQKCLEKSFWNLTPLKECNSPFDGYVNIEFCITPMELYLNKTQHDMYFA